MSANASAVLVEISSILSTKPYILGYAIPLLLTSIVVTFAGTWLTLDRTYMFAPLPDAVQPVPGAFGRERPKKFLFVFEGGVGGLLGSFVFGMHLSTFLALLVPNTTSDPPLSPASFVAVWVLSSVSIMAIGSRFRIASLLFLGISGGATFGVALAIILHPAQLSRVIVTAIFTVLLAVLVLLPLPRFQHGFLRFATASTGAFGMLISISLLGHITSWANAFSRLWAASSADWDSAQEKGLDAAYCAFLVSGAFCDWFLRRTFGDSPDEKWDSYLATYAANLPTANGEGSFQPLTSVWERIFGSNKLAQGARDPIRFPTDAELQAVPRLRKHRVSNAPELEHEMLRRKGDVKGRYGVKFRPLEGFSSGSESDDDDIKLIQTRDSSRGTRPWKEGNSPTISNDTTLADDDATRAMAAKKAALGGAAGLDYSDYESDGDAGTVRKKRRESLGTPEWTPGFMDRHRRKRGQSSTSGPNTNKETTSTTSVPAPPPGAVPVTPSLINALDRIAQAQKTAFPEVSSAPPPIPGLPEGTDQWGSFWNDVRAKASQSEADNLAEGGKDNEDGQVK